MRGPMRITTLQYRYRRHHGFSSDAILKEIVSMFNRG